MFALTTILLYAFYSALGMSGKSVHNCNRSEDAVGGEETVRGQCDGGGFQDFPVKTAPVLVYFKCLHTNTHNKQNSQDAYLVCKCCRSQKFCPKLEYGLFSSFDFLSYFILDTVSASCL